MVVAGAGAARRLEHDHTGNVVAGGIVKGALAGKTIGAAAAVGTRSVRGTGSTASEAGTVVVGSTGAIGAEGAL